MNGLDSPLEALTFIPVNLGTLLSAAVNNLWAWVAVVTAAFSFWRLRTTPKTTSPPYISLSPPPPPPEKPSPTITSSSEQNDIKQERGKKEEKEEEGVLTRGNSKKFFTVYYEEREEVDDDDDDEMDGGDVAEKEDESCDGVMRKGWGSITSEIRVEMRGGDYLGCWYNYQNRKVIDGSVVRLWEVERESSSPRSCRDRPSLGVTAALMLA